MARSSGNSRDGHPLHLALVGYTDEWPAAFETFVARELIGHDGAVIARLLELAEAPAFLRASETDALIVNADRLGPKETLALQECRQISPDTAIVVVATAAARGIKNALESGATAFVSWPATATIVRHALRNVRPRAPRLPVEPVAVAPIEARAGARTPRLPPSRRGGDSDGGR